MTTLQIDILNPKATQLLEDLAALDLIAIRQAGSDNFQHIVNKLRAHSDEAPSLEEITAEVESVRTEWHARK
ncbi:hypothetical protein CLV58_11010 [Spirosoma oryzae]|uniref:Uncharacterized protein n=1 Tax=Spirosoma oryzae TaxID=1469603 RepID=A0A2T0SVU3_9BACT|nr:hypothetical protein [Spirosoma oryzae]PRY37541.1 hypothetical protein CLV58_11010 [Spirosoma oryzae]